MHPLRDLQFRLEYLLLRVLVGLVRGIPMDIAVRLSARGWRVLAPLVNPKRHQRALDNLAIAFPEKSIEERQRIAMAHWENLGRVMAETMHLEKITREPGRVVIEHRRDGAVMVRFGSRYLSYREVTAGGEEKTAGEGRERATVKRPPPRSKAGSGQQKPAANHPWRKKVIG